MTPVPLGKYMLLRRLAWGGMAELYLARANDPGRAHQLLVVKLVARRFAADPAFVTMFQDEARIAALLNHPNIGRVLDVDRHRNRHFLVMEYLHGKDLRSICRRSLDLTGRPLSIDTAVRIAIRVCAALQHAHTARAADGAALKIIHRDVSPSNVMVTFDGEVKLVDFGIAKAANRATLTQPGMIKGKLRYLAPEQVLGIAIDHRCDIFVLGTTVWECTVGRHLYGGSNEAQVYEAISEGRVVPPTGLVPSYPPRLEQIVMRALARDREQRYASAHEMRLALEAFASEIGLDLSQDRAALARQLAQLFDEEVSGWQQALHDGRNLVDHLLATLPPPAGGEPHDNVRLLAAGPREPALQPRRTLPFGEQPSPVAGSFEAVKPRGSAVGPITLGAAPRGAAAAALPVKRPEAGIPLRSFTPGRRGPGKVAAEASSRELPDQPVAHVIGPASAIEPAESSRPTTVDADERRPTAPFVRKSPAAEPASGRATTGAGPDVATEPPLALGLMDATTEPWTRPSADSGVPDEEPDPDLVQDRPRTGDWAHRMLAGNQARPGTHPYFKNQGPSPQPGSRCRIDPTARVSTTSNNTDLSRLIALGWGFGWVNLRPAVITGGLLLLALLGLAAWIAFGRGNTDPAEQTEQRLPGPAAPGHEARAAGRPAAAARPPTAHRLRLTTAPAAATAYVARDGRALGTTPLDVDPREVPDGKIELRMDGFHTVQLTLDRGRAAQHVVLQARGSGAQQPRRKGAAPRERPRRRGRDGEILDPF